MKDNRFNFFVPATISKAVDSQGNEIMEIQGVASTTDRDLEGEKLNPSGFEVDYFLKNGLLKWEHGKDPKSYIGTPVEARVTPTNDFFIKGVLWPESETAREAYKLAKVLEKSNSGRRIGWSIEGNALEKSKDGKDIPRARITNVVLTMNPVNTQTWAEIVKSKFAAEYIEPKFEESTACSGQSCIFSIIDGKEEILVDKDFNIIRKSIEPDILKENLEDVPKDFLGDLIKEHEVLIGLLKTGTQEERDKEAERQEKELAEYKQHHSSIQKTLDTKSGGPLIRESIDGVTKVTVDKGCIKKAVVVLEKALSFGLIPKEEEEKIKNHWSKQKFNYI